MITFIFVIILTIAFAAGLKCIETVLVMNKQTKPLPGRFDPLPIKGKFDPHETRKLELQNFGEEWVKDFGTTCDNPCITCGTLKPPKGPGGGSRRIPPAKRPQAKIEPPRVTRREVWKNGYSVPQPDIVPEGATLTQMEGYGIIGPLASFIWEWFDVGGKRNAYRVMAIQMSELEFIRRQENKRIMQKHTDRIGTERVLK